MNIKSVNTDQNYKKTYKQNFGQFAFTSEASRTNLSTAISQLPRDISRIFADAIQETKSTKDLVLVDVNAGRVDLFKKGSHKAIITPDILLSMIFRTLLDICPNIKKTTKPIANILEECPIISREQALKDFSISS